MNLLGDYMSKYVSSALAGLIAAGALTIFAAPGVAQDKQPAATWNAAVSADGKSGSAFSEEQVKAINAVDAYFKDLDNVKGRFVQYSAKNKRMKGKYYIKKPGRFRFDYNRPSRMVIISDGRRLVIQDHDLNTEDQIALKKTPFRVLVRKNVNILRDAKIKFLKESDDQIVIELLDKNPKIAGGIKLFFEKKPELRLKEWITTDVQGLKTRIELVSLEKVKKLSSKLFKVKTVMLPKF